MVGGGHQVDEPAVVLARPIIGTIGSVTSGTVVRRWT
jgi:hypothetical protein